jgi:hypothetical protein
MTERDNPEVDRAAALLRRGGVPHPRVGAGRDQGVEDLGADEIVTGVSPDGAVTATVHVFDDWDDALAAESSLLEADPSVRTSTNGALLLVVRATGDDADDAVSAVLEGFAGRE